VPLGATRKVTGMMSYKFDLGVQVLEVDVVADLHVLDLHLEVLVLFELLKTIGAFIDSLVEGIAQ
jgi:hypothetical protein